MRIIAVSNPHPANPDIKREWRYCLRAKGSGFRTLVDAAAYASGYGDIVDIGPIMLTGAYVAHTTETTASGGRYDNNLSASSTCATWSREAAGATPSTAV